MKITSLLLGLMLVSPLAISQTFLTKEELLETFPGATISGISSKDGVSKWSQVYGEDKKGKAKGKGKGKFNGSPYSYRWKVKKGKWCENWGDGNYCWDVERIDANTLQLYKKGKALKNVWNIES